MITRRRYMVSAKNKAVHSARDTAGYIGGGRTEESLMLRAASYGPQQSWWKDWRSITAVLALVSAIGASLYLVKAKEDSYGSNWASEAPRASGAASKPAPLSSPARHAASTNAGSNRQGSIGDAESFLAFSRARKAASDGGGPSSRAAGPETASYDGPKLVMSDKLSGECNISGGSIKEMMQGLSDCFSRHGARGE